MTRVTSQLSAVTPYVMVGSMVLSPYPHTGATRPSIADSSFCTVTEQTWHWAGDSSTSVSQYAFPRRPALIPVAIVPMASYGADTYEPFIISEGWREEASIVGPFLVEEDNRPFLVFDEYDLSAIDQYE